MAFSEISRWSADADGVNDRVPAWTYAMSSICASSCAQPSFALHSVTCESIKVHHYRGCSNQLNAAQRRWGEKMEGMLPEDTGGKTRVLYLVQNFFPFFFVKSNTTSLRICLLIGHYSSSDWPVKGAWKAGERLWLYQATHGDVKNNSTNRGRYIIPTSPLWSQKYYMCVNLNHKWIIKTLFHPLYIFLINQPSLVL